MDALKDLRPAHLPTEPSFWPPSGLALATLLALVILVGTALYFWQKKRLSRLRPKLRRELLAIESRFREHHATDKLQADVSRLLRSALLGAKKDKTLLSKRLSELELELGFIFTNKILLNDVIILLSSGRFLKVPSIEPEELLNKTKELIASCRL